MQQHRQDTRHAAIALTLEASCKDEARVGQTSTVELHNAKPGAVAEKGQPGVPGVPHPLRLNRELGITTVYVTHDQIEAMTMADKIVVLRAGRIEQVGSPLALYEHPANLFVAGFIGSPAMNFLAGTIESADAAGAVVHLAGGQRLRAEVDATRARPGDAVTLGIRPEHLRPASGADNRLDAEVTFVEQLGSATFAYARLPGLEATLTAQLDGALRLKSGSPLALQVPAAAVVPRCRRDANRRSFNRQPAAD